MIEKIFKTISDNIDKYIPIGIVILSFYIAAIV